MTTIALPAADWAIIDFHLYYAAMNKVTGFEGNSIRATTLLAHFRANELPDVGTLDDRDNPQEVLSAPFWPGEVVFMLELLRNTTLRNWNNQYEYEVPTVISRLSAFRR